MRSSPGLILAVLALSASAIAGPGALLSATVSGAEVQQNWAADMGGSRPMYALGMRLDNVTSIFRAGALMEIGWLNGRPSYSGGFDLLLRLPLFKERLELSAGPGLTYNGYTRFEYPEGSRTGTFIHRYSPVMSLQAMAYGKASVAVDFLFESEVFWKVRAGWTLATFR
jgi:hypothetical protein